MDDALYIYTDGGCSGNPGPGGWAYVMVLQAFQSAGKQDSARIIAQDKGGEKETTNNRMELTAVIMALRALKNFDSALSSITLLTDSQYVQKGITEWIHSWKRNSWRTSGKSPVKNKELWVELDALAGGVKIKWEWIKGHAGNEYNEMCDAMTQEAISNQR